MVGVAPRLAIYIRYYQVKYDSTMKSGVPFHGSSLLLFFTVCVDIYLFQFILEVVL